MRNHYEELLQQGKLPVLKIIDINDVLLHEYTDQNRAARLKTRIELSGVIQNPVICTEAPGTNKYVLLDGAHRYQACKSLNCKYVPAQIVDYHDPLLLLKKWRHLFYSEDVRSFTNSVKQIQGILCETGIYSPDKLIPDTMPRFYAQIIFKSGDYIGLTGKHDLPAKIETINALASLYIPNGLIDRISYDDIESLEKHYQEYTGLILYPRFKKEEVIQIAFNTHKLPAGITRHLIPKRALHLNLPLSMLRFTDSRIEVEKFLMDFINHKIHNNAIRFYSESTFFFDD